MLHNAASTALTSLMEPGMCNKADKAGLPDLILCFLPRSRFEVLHYRRKIVQRLFIHDGSQEPYPSGLAVVGRDLLKPPVQGSIPPTRPVISYSTNHTPSNFFHGCQVSEFDRLLPFTYPVIFCMYYRDKPNSRLTNIVSKEPRFLVRRRRIR